MKTYIYALLLACSTFVLHGQVATIKKSYPTNNIQTVAFDFQWSDVVFEEADGNELQINANVEINGGEANDNFEIKSRSSNGRLDISTDVIDMDKITKMITVKHNGTKYRIRKTSGYKKRLKELKDELGLDRIDSYNEGVDIDISITIKLPKALKLMVESTYGDVELSQLGNEMNIDNTYGHINITFDPNQKLKDTYLNATYAFIDVSIPASFNANIDLKTSYGKLFTDMDIDIDTKRSSQEAFSNHIVGKLNSGGPALKMKSTYGKVYLRELKM